MILERVEIVGFRGINRLSLMLEQNNVLIGENAWGKSSLLDALTLLLSPESDLYHFERDDFWFPPGDINGREHHLHIILTFRESLRADIGFAVISSWKRAGRHAPMAITVFLSSGRGECGRRQRDDTAQFSR